MTLNEEEDRGILLEIFERVVIPGAIAERLVRLKNLVRNAKIEEVKN